MAGFLARRLGGKPLHRSDASSAIVTHFVRGGVVSEYVTITVNAIPELNCGLARSRRQNQKRFRLITVTANSQKSNKRR
jgi:glucose-6-phosphate dehydrogenase assembly protein OpcA